MRTHGVMLALSFFLAARICAAADPPATPTNTTPPAPAAAPAPTDSAAAKPAAPPHSARPPEPKGVWFEGERHLADVKQLTFGGQNAEAYWSPNGDALIFQATPVGAKCDQIYTMKSDGADKRMVSTGKGRCTCSYFIPGTDRILFSSTHAGADTCPPEPDFSHGYVWPLYADYDIWTAKRDGTDLKRLTDSAGYDAEATCSVDGKWIVFTSTRDGDIDLYKMRVDGSDVTRLTNEPGYDGGAYFSHDGTKICYRYGRVEGEEQLTEYRSLLAKHLVHPTKLEIYWMNADGTGKTQVTSANAASFAPYFTPDDKRIIFASNMKDPRGRDFDLFLVGLDGKGLEQVTFCPSFDSFPMFSLDGKRLAFASNRNGSVPGETNIFVANWVE